MALPWDQEGDLVEARQQVRAQAATRAGGQNSPRLVRLSSGDPRRGLAAIEAHDAGGGSADGPAGPVVVADTVLWDWSDADLRRLSDLLRARKGLLVFIEPTAGLAARRIAQRLGRRRLRRRLGHDFERDVPAELRSAGFIVTTQVRLQHGRVGDYVRGEARHFDEA